MGFRASGWRRDGKASLAENIDRLAGPRSDLSGFGIVAIVEMELAPAGPHDKGCLAVPVYGFGQDCLARRINIENGNAAALPAAKSERGGVRVFGRKLSAQSGADLGPRSDRRHLITPNDADGEQGYSSLSITRLPARERVHDRPPTL